MGRRMIGAKGTNPRGVGEIVQVQGGHIIRATGLKDRHSKVFTAKGPRDRRVRLSAHTAIQFYDVQDRLGYDRPSKAVDWLMQKAKDSIDKLPELPKWDPSEVVVERDQIPHTGVEWEDSGMHLQNYPHEQLSLSIQGNNTNHQASGSLGFDGGGGEPSNHEELGRFTRLMGWSCPPFLQPQVAYNFQRGTLQSTNLFSHPNLVQQSNHFPIPGMGLGPEGGFMGYSIPCQLHQDGSNTNASSSSLSPNSSNQR